jgi:hypothetical protein
MTSQTSTKTKNDRIGAALDGQPNTVMEESPMEKFHRLMALYHVGRRSPKTWEILELLDTRPDLTQRQIAAQFGISEQRIEQYKRRYLVNGLSAKDRARIARNEAIGDDLRAGELTVKAIARKHGCDTPVIYRLAYQHGLLTKQRRGAK